MEQFRINVRFDGLDADDHVIDMRLFGEALIGLERTLSVGLNALAAGGEVRPRSKLALTVKATPPRDGCVQFDAVVELAQGLLPIMAPELIIQGGKLAKHLISAVIRRVSGQKKQASADVEAILDVLKIEKADRRRESDMVIALVDRLRPSAVMMMAPVGRSAEKLSVIDDEGPESASVFDVAMAQALRSKAELEVSDMLAMRLRVDGVTVHNRTLKIEDPSEPGRFVTAEVRDPAFTDGENLYTTSVTKVLEVQAKATYRDGKLYRLHIMDAKAA